MYSNKQVTEALKLKMYNKDITDKTEHGFRFKSLSIKWMKD